ncbi:hypothetical protein ARMGADRAFT_1087722 [Armillaria gallica]|uniref:Uncharacterized protein n=1 Tax=Armillaria gallica TaxID=47427 RepID=A0A2H3D890_ARMGA|nr:hypothetical protein ARMGADRAFT_1087722 [Armillaria gallica]
MPMQDEYFSWLVNMFTNMPDCVQDVYIDVIFGTQQEDFLLNVWRNLGKIFAQQCHKTNLHVVFGHKELENYAHYFWSQTYFKKSMYRCLDSLKGQGHLQIWTVQEFMYREKVNPAVPVTKSRNPEKYDVAEIFEGNKQELVVILIAKVKAKQIEYLIQSLPELEAEKEQVRRESLFPEEMYPVHLTFCPQSTLSDLWNQSTPGSFLFTNLAIVGVVVHDVYALAQAISLEKSSSFQGST